jgi:hypothetical protein
MSASGSQGESRCIRCGTHSFGRTAASCRPAMAGMHHRVRATRGRRHSQRHQRYQVHTAHGDSLTSGRERDPPAWASRFSLSVTPRPWDPSPIPHPQARTEVKAVVSAARVHGCEWFHVHNVRRGLSGARAAFLEAIGPDGPLLWRIVNRCPSRVLVGQYCRSGDHGPRDVPPHGEGFTAGQELWPCQKMGRYRAIARDTQP